MSHESAHLFYPLSYTKEEPCSFHNTYGSYIITYPNWDTFVQGNAKLEKKKKYWSCRHTPELWPKYQDIKSLFVAIYSTFNTSCPWIYSFFHQSPALVSHGFTVLKKKRNEQVSILSFIAGPFHLYLSL